MKRVVILLTTLCACSSTATDAPAKDAPKSSDSAPTEAKTPADEAKPEPATPEPTEPTTQEPATPEPTTPEPTAPPIPTAPPGEVAINPWHSTPHTATWRLVAEPTEALTFVAEIDAGVLGRAGASWFQRGEDGSLATVTMDREPTLPIFGVWPSDAWCVERRDVEDGEMTYHELRLMKLRGGDRWVPQVYDGGGGEQWYHPGTDHENLPHISTLSGMLVYSDEFDSISRVAGKHPDPEIGAHRGEVVDFVESGAGNVYVLSYDSDYFAQIACPPDDQACVDTNAKKLPLTDWKFDRKVARGRHSVSVLARNGVTMTSEGERDFILHHRGKSDGWLLDELPAGERPTGMWASDEGGLWTLAGERLRWRDTESVWHDVGLPEGMTTPSVALTEDRKEVWVAGQVGGATKVFAASANAAVPAAPAPTAPTP